MTIHSIPPQGLPLSLIKKITNPFLQLKLSMQTETGTHIDEISGTQKVDVYKERISRYLQKYFYPLQIREHPVQQLSNWRWYSRS